MTNMQVKYSGWDSLWQTIDIFVRLELIEQEDSNDLFDEMVDHDFVKVWGI